MNKLLNKKSKNDINNQQGKSLKKVFFKVCVWILFIVVPVAIIILAKIGVYRLFFSINPHFLLREIQIEIVKGNFSKDYIIDKLRVKIGVGNLYEIAPREMRERLLSDPIIQEVEIRRILPDTLNLTVYGRTPVAQLINNEGRLIDSEGIILGTSIKGNSKIWPIITGIQNISSFKTGEKLDNPLVLGAIRFLAAKEVADGGHLLDVQLIQLNENYHELRLYLNRNDETFIREGAVLILPLKGHKTALKKALEILKLRIQAQQPTSFIDATYQKRIPVRP